MFTGIIEQTGSIKTLSRRRNTYRLEITPGEKFDSVKKGESLSINGVCLTAVDIRGDLLFFDITEETFKRTSFSHLRAGDIVNIERSLEWKSRIDGHFVLGHVDKTAAIKSIKKDPHPYIDIAVTPDDKIYVVKKGSIAIDGTSLTINEIYEDSIRAYIIPYTLENTNLKYKKKNNIVNIEFDILGKYAENRVFYKKDRPLALTKGFLKNNGFI